MKKARSPSITSVKRTPVSLAALMTILVVGTPRATITSRPMNAKDADAIRKMLVEKIGTLNCMLVATDVGDVIIGGDALKQSLIHFQPVTGKEGAMASLLAQVKGILSNSTHPDAESFDAKKWLESWVQLPQLSFSGEAPINLIGTEAGLKAVQRALAAMETRGYL